MGCYFWVEVNLSFILKIYFPNNHQYWHASEYLGVHPKNKLSWSHNTDALYMKDWSRHYLLKRLSSFEVDGVLLEALFDSVEASSVFCSVVCGSSSLSKAERKQLVKLIRKASPKMPPKPSADHRWWEPLLDSPSNAWSYCWIGELLQCWILCARSSVIIDPSSQQLELEYFYHN